MSQHPADYNACFPNTEVRRVQRKLASSRIATKLVPSHASRCSYKPSMCVRVCVFGLLKFHIVSAAASAAQCSYHPWMRKIKPQKYPKGHFVVFLRRRKVSQLKLEAQTTIIWQRRECSRECAGQVKMVELFSCRRDFLVSRCFPFRAHIGSFVLCLIVYTYTHFASFQPDRVCSFPFQ